MLQRSPALTHRGPLDSSTREIPVLAFIGKYIDAIDALDFSGPFHTWYSANCLYYSNIDAAVYHKGEVVHAWMQHLYLKQFRAVKHNVHGSRVFKETTPSGQESHAVMVETTTTFWLRDPYMVNEPIVVPRFLSFVVVKADISGQGTNGWQILEAKAWGDSHLLRKALTSRKRQARLMASAHSSPRPSQSHSHSHSSAQSTDAYAPSNASSISYASSITASSSISNLARKDFNLPLDMGDRFRISFEAGPQSPPIRRRATTRD